MIYSAQLGGRRERRVAARPDHPFVDFPEPATLPEMFETFSYRFHDLSDPARCKSVQDCLTCLVPDRGRRSPVTVRCKLGSGVHFTEFGAIEIYDGRARFSAG